MSQEQTKSYIISADCKKSTYQEEHWINIINGKQVKLMVTTYYRWGTFIINLTDKQKDEILKKKEIVLNEYDCEFQEMWDGDCQYIELDKENYSETELKEIYKLIYEDPEEEIYDEDFMESKGWYIDDTIYGFSSGCVLEESKSE